MSAFVRRSDDPALQAMARRGRTAAPGFKEGRRATRLALAEPVVLRTPYAELSAWLIDMSPSGLAVSVTNGFMPGCGEEVAVTLRDGKHLWGYCRRIDGAVLAIEFPVAIADMDELVSLELRGAEIYRGR